MDLKQYIKHKKEKGMMAYMPYLTLGDPSLSRTMEYSLALIEAGADLLELGIPFSDPTADGPVIQAAMDRALRHKISWEDIFSLCSQIHEKYPHIPLIFLSYLNPILNGVEFIMPGQNQQEHALAVKKRLQFFLKKCSASGVHGLVIPDLPFDQPESIILRELAESYNVAQILMIAPNTPLSRLERVCHAARGWLYYVSSFGVTGTRKELPPDLISKIQSLNKKTDIPILAGFGFHEAKQVMSLRGVIDGVIVGSKNQEIIAKKPHEAHQDLQKLTEAFVQACHLNYQRET